MAGLLVVGMVGCFSPSFPEGAVACGPNDQCPSGLLCAAGVCVDERPPIEPDAGNTVRLDAAAPSPDGALVTMMVAAEIAVCSSPLMPSPDLCAISSGPGQLSVDANDTMLGIEFRGFVRFDVPDLDGRRVVDARLIMTTTDDVKAPSAASGVVWLVEPFNDALLQMQVPDQVGADPIADDQGAVGKLQAVTWPIPPSLVVGNDSLHLGITTPETDGAHYFNNDGDAPPTLVLDIN